MHLQFRIILGCLFLAQASQLQAQHTDYVDSTQVQVLADQTKSYVVPDVKGRKWTKAHNKLFTFQLGFAPIIDYNANWQDNDSKAQVGEQPSRFDLRSGRVMARGKINFKRPWNYLISVEYKGLDRTEDMNAFGLTDLKLVIPLDKHSELFVGKIKETFSYEMVGDAANLTHQERLMNPFFNSRNNGIIYRRFFLQDRLTAAAGWFRPWPGNKKGFGETANTFTARVTGLPKWMNDGKQFIHMAVSMRYVEAQDGMVRLKGKNESNISSNYVDTKSFAADHQFNLGIEQLWSLDNFSVLFEMIHNWTKTPAGTEQFKGYYVTTSYVISGEQRPYDKRAGYARRVKPDGKGGAWELWGRVGRVNLNGRNIEGGLNNRYTAGLNWWATQYWKVGLNYGVSNLLKDDRVGITHSLQWRIQWIL